MYKVNIVALEERVSKDGSVSYVLKCLVKVLSYGKVTLKMIEVKVPNLTPYKMGERDLDLVLPFQEYPYRLA